MTPRGLVLCNFSHKVRAYEAALARLVFQHAAALAEYPVAFDAAAEGVFVEGGDVIVLNEGTLLAGVGNATTAEAAQRLAQKLKLEVIAVQMPSRAWAPGEWEGLQLLFYHLDCLVNFIDAQTVLAVPYLLEKEHSQRNPLLDVLFGAARLASLARESRTAMIDEVRGVGWITRYAAGSGKEDKSLRVKLIDFLHELRVRPIYVGGDRPQAESEPKHVVERVVRECRFMATNIVAIEPGHVLAYDGNEHTLGALKRAGYRVTTIPAHELVRANGGPHCLTLPLERREPREFDHIRP
jgi:arginine deiminase